ncbi:MAG: hypothetical protein IKK10_00220 [Clostridia bacterium]|nr:hypothetical protein [Clostridia bacterium]
MNFSPAVDYGYINMNLIKGGIAPVANDKIMVENPNKKGYNKLVKTF